MQEESFMQKSIWCALAFVAIATGANAQDGGAAAQAVQPPVPAMATDTPKRFTVTVGADVLTSYLFRGIHQESDGIVAQPPLDLGVTLGRGISLNVGHWYSMHSGPTGSFYEADYYGSMTFSAGRLKPGVLFTSYTSPNASFGTVHELAAFVSVDDSDRALPLSPKATVAFELDGQADGGANQGTYLELSIRPAKQVPGAPRSLTLAVPVRLGLSLKDYYEGPDGSDRFGFFSTGLIASVPVTTGKVAWDIHGGVEMSWLGNNMKALNANDGFKPIGIVGVTMTY
jgi:hypothetical protein